MPSSIACRASGRRAVRGAIASPALSIAASLLTASVGSAPRHRSTTGRRSCRGPVVVRSRRYVASAGSRPSSSVRVSTGCFVRRRGVAVSSSHRRRAGRRAELAVTISPSDVVRAVGVLEGLQHRRQLVGLAGLEDLVDQPAAASSTSLRGSRSRPSPAAGTCPAAVPTTVSDVGARRGAGVVGGGQLGRRAAARGDVVGVAALLAVEHVGAVAGDQRVVAGAARAQCRCRARPRGSRRRRRRRACPGRRCRRAKSLPASPWIDVDAGAAADAVVAVAAVDRVVAAAAEQLVVAVVAGIDVVARRRRSTGSASCRRVPKSPKTMSLPAPPSIVSVPASP